MMMVVAGDAGPDGGAMRGAMCSAGGDMTARFAMRACRMSGMAVGGLRSGRGESGHHCQ